MKKSFKNKIYTAFLFGFTITILSCAVIVFGFALPSIYKSNLRSEQELTNQTMKRVDAYLKQINALCTQVSYTRSTRDILAKEYDGSAARQVEYIYDSTEMFQLYNDFLRPYQGIYGIFIYNVHGQPYYYCPSSHVDRYYDIQNEPWYQELQNCDDYGHYVLSGTHCPPQLADSTDIISLYRNIHNILDYEVIGQAEIMIRPQSLYTILRDSVTGEDGQGFTLVDSSGSVLVSTGELTAGDSYDSDTFNALINNEKISLFRRDALSYCFSDYSGWYLIRQFGAASLYEDSYTIILSFVVFSLLAWFIMAVWGRIIAQQTTKPLAILASGVSHIEKGDFDNRIVIDSNDEFSDLADSFNQMAETLKNNIQHIYDIENQKAEAQMTALQAQINPHFTLNTINSVKHMAMLQNSTNIISMLDDFSLLLTAAFRFPNELITLGEELDRIRAFARIQSVASFGKIQLHLQYDDQVLQYLTLGLILQPLVENSVFHGIKPKMASHQMESGNISIQVEAVGDVILIHVIDDGIGMSQEHADALLTNKAAGVGVNNVHKRIQLRFGEEYGLTIKSAPQKGCDVLIRIPKIENN